VQKIYYIIVLILLLLFIGACAGFGIQSYRLQQYMDECRQYREQLTAATNRQSEITGVVEHTNLILSETVNSVAELREQLKAVEDDYNRLYSICFDNGNIISNREE
jgi:hypothetical protein